MKLFSKEPFLYYVSIFSTFFDPDQSPYQLCIYSIEHSENWPFSTPTYSVHFADVIWGWSLKRMWKLEDVICPGEFLFLFFFFHYKEELKLDWHLLISSKTTRNVAARLVLHIGHNSKWIRKLFFDSTFLKGYKIWLNLTFFFCCKTWIYITLIWSYYNVR